ncbi:MAG: Ig-like domain-containing protein [Patescibacteria group bacterium]|jgi:hypothetical protein
MTGQKPSSSWFHLGARDLPFLAALASILALVPLIYFGAQAQTAALAITSGPSVPEVALTENGATIVWDTNIEATTVVLFGTGPELGQTLKKIEPMPGEPEVSETRHTYSFLELASGTTYYYKVRSVSADGAMVESSVRSFVTKASAALLKPLAPALEKVSIKSPASGFTVQPPVRFEAATDAPADVLEFRLTNPLGTVILYAGSFAAGVWSASLPDPLPGTYTLRAVATGPDGVGGKISVGSEAVSFIVKAPAIEKPAEEPLKQLVSVCGNAKCEPGEGPDVCAKDCPPTKPLPPAELQPLAPPDPAKELPVKPLPPLPPAEPEPGEETPPLPPLPPRPPLEVPDAGSSPETTDLPPAPPLPLLSPLPLQPPMSVDLQAAVESVNLDLAGPTPTPAPPVSGGSSAGSAPEPQLTPDQLLCRQAGVPPLKCELWIQATYADKTCAEAGIATQESCIEFLSKKNDGQFPGCEDRSASECDEIKSRSIAGYMPTETREKVDEVIAKATEEKVIPNLPGVIGISQTAAKDAEWRASAPSATGVETSAVVIIIDADKDGLPDDLEKILGTDPNDADTDGDGVNDGDEVDRGTDSKSRSEKTEQETDQTVRALATRQPLEQPRGAGQVSPSFSVQVAPATGSGAPEDRTPGAGNANLNLNGEVAGGVGGRSASAGLRLQGTSLPGMTCLLYVYSYVPVVLTTTADANGNWTYDLGSSLNDGEHTVYVAVTDDTGKITEKSNPLSFIVAEARAVTVDELLATPAAAAVVASPEADLRRWYILGVIVLILFAAAVVTVLVRRSGRSEIK